MAAASHAYGIAPVCDRYKWSKMKDCKETPDIVLLYEAKEVLRYGTQYQWITQFYLTSLHLSVNGMNCICLRVKRVQKAGTGGGTWHISAFCIRRHVKIWR